MHCITLLLRYDDHNQLNIPKAQTYERSGLGLDSTTKLKLLQTEKLSSLLDNDSFISQSLKTLNADKAGHLVKNSLPKLKQEPIIATREALDITKPSKIGERPQTGSNQQTTDPMASSFQKKIRNFDFHKIIIRLVGSIDGCTDVGLTRLRFFDNNGESIRIERHMIVTYASILHPVDNLLLENPHTRRAGDMFLAEFPLLKNSIDIQASYFGPPLALVRVWNYMADSGKGARAIEILENGQTLSNAYLKPAPIETNVEYHQDILIDPKAKIPSYSITQGRAPLQEEFDTIFDKLEQENQKNLPAANIDHSKVSSSAPVPEVRMNFSKNKREIAMVDSLSDIDWQIGHPQKEESNGNKLNSQDDFKIKREVMWTSTERLENDWPSKRISIKDSNAEELYSIPVIKNSQLLISQSSFSDLNSKIG